jgi:hypothetical protein
MLIRNLFGFTGAQLTDGALGTGATRTDAAEIITFLDGFMPVSWSSDLCAGQLLI